MVVMQRYNNQTSVKRLLQTNFEGSLVQWSERPKGSTRYAQNNLANTLQKDQARKTMHGLEEK